MEVCFGMIGSRHTLVIQTIKLREMTTVATVRFVHQEAEVGGCHTSARRWASHVLRTSYASRFTDASPCAGEGPREKSTEARLHCCG